MDKNIYAAIAMALYDYAGNNVHDTEPTVDHHPAETHAVGQPPGGHDGKAIDKTVKTQDERVQIYD